MAYAKARSDFEYLETLEKLYDWVEIDAEVESLMQNPTKKKACDLYESCINLWFNENSGSDHTKKRRVIGIADRYFIPLSYLSGHN